MAMGKSALRLPDIVRVIVCSEDIDVSENDIFETVKFLLQDNICQEPKTLFKIGKMVNDQIEYEKAFC
jgi:hypothetical protein